MKTRSKEHWTDLRYNTVSTEAWRESKTDVATLRHRRRGRIRNKINAAKFESRRTGDDSIVIDAAVNVLMGMV